MKKIFVLVGAIFLGATLSAESGKSVGWVTAEPVARVSVAAGRAATVALRFRVADGYHINSNKPRSELLIPTELKLEAPAGVRIDTVAYPEGSEFALSFDPTEKLSVYSGEFVVTAKLSAVRGAAAGSYPLSGVLSYQACNDRACFPPKKLPVSLEVRITPAH
jgi:hypothetical protein